MLNATGAVVRCLSRAGFAQSVQQRGAMGWSQGFAASPYYRQVTVEFVFGSDGGPIRQPSQDARITREYLARYARVLSPSFVVAEHPQYPETALLVSGRN